MFNIYICIYIYVCVYICVPEFFFSPNCAFQEIAWCNKEILVPISGKSQSRLVYSQGYKPTLPKSKNSKSEEQILIPIGLSESENKKEIIRSLSILDTVLNLSHKTSNINIYPLNYTIE